MYPVEHRSSVVQCTLSFVRYSSCDHRDLPSFPTRRSSDLKNAADADHRPEPGGQSGHPLMAPSTTCLEWAYEVHRGLDRKSTRLNSSHLGISYAVFCLKKKRNRKLTRS